MSTSCFDKMMILFGFLHGIAWALLVWLWVGSPV